MGIMDLELPEAVLFTIQLFRVSRTSELSNIH